MAARDPDWDLGEVAAAHSLWVEQRGRLQRQAHRAKRLPPDVAPFVKAHDASLSPYKGAHIVTVLLDAEGPKLLFDGVELSGDGIVLPMPQTTPGAHGIYAPLAFTALVVGSGVPPDEVTVSFEQAGEVLERARLHAATDVDPEAQCYLFPYPVPQTLHLVRAAWEDARGENSDGQLYNTDDGRDLGYLSQALPRLRQVLRDMDAKSDAAKDLNKNFKAPPRPATVRYRKMASLHRAVLAYAIQGPGAYFGDVEDSTSWEAAGKNAGKTNGNDDGFGKGGATRLRRLGLAGAPRYGLLEFYPRSVSARIVVRVGGKTWILTGAAVTNAQFQAKRARLSTLLGLPEQLGSLEHALNNVRLAKSDENGPTDRGKPEEYVDLPTGDKAPFGDPLGYVRAQVWHALVANREAPPPGSAMSSNPEPNANYNASNPTQTTATLRVWGPPLLRKPTQQVTLDRSQIGEEADEVKEARAATREAFNALTRDFEDAQRRNRGPLRSVAWYATGNLPASAVPLGDAWSVGDVEEDESAPKVPRTASELPARRNAFATSAVLPLAAATCIGAFRPSEALAESNVRARIGGGGALAPQVDALTRLGLKHTPEAMAALLAFSDLIVHECLRPDPSGRARNDPIDSAVRRAQRHALAAAKLLRNMYAATERTERLFLRETDPLFVTALGGRAALVCVRHLPCWVLAHHMEQKQLDAQPAENTRARAEGRAPRDLSDRPLWSRACRDSASAFTEALRRLGQLDRSPVHPVAFPLLPLQALLTWPESIAPKATHGTPLGEHRLRLAQNGAAVASELSATTAHTQLYAARLSVARAARLGQALKLPDIEQRDVAALLAYARPAAVRAGEVEALLGLHARRADLDRLLGSAAINAARQPPPGAGERLERVWASRALDTYARWRHEEASRGADADVAGALAALSLQPSGADAPQTFYAPFGTSPSASPLAGVNPGIAEARVWTRHTGWDVDGTLLGAREVQLVLKPCTPYDGVLVDEKRGRTAHSHPHTFTLTPPSGERAEWLLTVPVSLEPFGATGALVDALRRTMFTAERLCQALQCAAAHGATLVTIEATGQPAERLAGALALALGMLPNTTRRAFGLRFATETDELRLARGKFNAIASALKDDEGMRALALCEAAAVVAALVG